MEIKNETQFPDMSFARVLVVDDMMSIRVMMAGLMKKYKIETDCMGSGEEALERIKSGNPEYHAVFMDHQMPGMDGIETVRLVRSLDSGYAKNIPIIAITGDETPGSEQFFLENGFQAFMEKPLNLAKLDPVLRKWLCR